MGAPLRVINFDTGMPTALLPSQGVISVLDFNADPTGAKDSSAAFTAAIAALQAEGGSVVPGGTLWIPPGQYLLNSTVTIAASNIVVAGAGTASLIVNGQTAATALQFGDNVTVFNRCGIRDVSFGQASGSAAVSGNFGLSLFKQSNFNLSNVQMFNFPQALNRGMLWSTVTQSFFTAIGIQSCIDIGIDMRSCTDCYISRSRSDANGTIGWSLRDSNGIYCSNCSGFNNTTSAWRIASLTGHNINFFFYNCIGDTSGSYNWQISDLTESVFTSCWGATQQSTAANTFANGFILSGSAVHDINFIGGNTLNNNASGVHLSNISGMPTAIHFVGFNFSDSAHGNGQSGTGFGLEIENAACTVSVMGGQAIGNVTGAVSLGASATATISQLLGFNPVGTSAAANVGASPATITAGPSAETHYLNQSATNTATVTKNTRQIHALVNASTFYPVQLGPNESYVVTWVTTQPTFTKDVH